MDAFHQSLQTWQVFYATVGAALHPSNMVIFIL